MPESFRIWTWARTSSRKGLAMEPASILRAPGAWLDVSTVLDAMIVAVCVFEMNEVIVLSNF